MATSKSVVFSTVDGVDIALDYYLPQTASPSSKTRGVLVWYHGGGLIQGTRKAACPHLIAAVDKYNLCLVSPDYRLAPQSRFPAILTDVAAAMSYVRSSAFSTLTGGAADNSKIIVTGGSAGGWLSLLVGTGIGFKACGVTPPEKPLAICPIYPITDLASPFWTTKQKIVTYLPKTIEHAVHKDHVNPDAPAVSFATPESTRAGFYPYMIQEAILASLLLDGTNIPPESFAIAPLLASGDFTAPPTFIVHGTIDDKVPIEQSQEVYDALLKSEHPDVEFEIVDGVDHLYDKNPAEEMTRMYAFINRILDTQ